MSDRKWPEIDEVFGWETGRYGERAAAHFRKWLTEKLPVEVLDKIAPKEPMRVEYKIQFPDSGGINEASVHVQDISIFVRPTTQRWAGKQALVTVTEIIPDQCEHDWRRDCLSNKYKLICAKCGNTEGDK